MKRNPWRLYDYQIVIPSQKADSKVGVLIRTRKFPGKLVTRLEGRKVSEQHQAYR